MVFRVLFSALVAFGMSGYGQMMKPMEIDEEGRVRFRVDAASASRVAIVGRGAGNGLGASPIVLTRQSGGVWEVVTEPIRPGFHYYDVLIDGVPTTDPQNHAYFGWGRWTSGLEVPDAEADFYLAKPDVSRGEVRIVYYDSTTTGRTRRCLVYTPPGYDSSGELQFPVLYLQHGAGESEVAWLEQGKVNFIMDNLIGEGRAEPMLVVMDNGYAASPGAENWYRPPSQASRFEPLILEELVPFIESRFRVASGPEGRAIAGLSMGGQQAATLVIRNPGAFSYLGILSGGLPTTSLVNSDVANRLNEEMELIWIGTGLQDEYLHSYILPARNAFTRHGVEHQYEAIEGTHEWQVWRKCLYRFASKLFKPLVSSERIDVGQSPSSGVGSEARISVHTPSRPELRLQRSEDLADWSDVDSETIVDPNDQTVALSEAGRVFLRLAEEPWK